MNGNNCKLIRIRSIIYNKPKFVFNDILYNDSNNKKILKYDKRKYIYV